MRVVVNKTSLSITGMIVIISNPSTRVYYDEQTRHPNTTLCQVTTGLVGGHIGPASSLLWATISWLPTALSRYDNQH